MRRGCVAGWWQDRDEAVEEEAAAAADGWHVQAPAVSPAPHPADSGRPRPCASAWASALDFGPGLRPWTSAGALFSGLRQPPSTDALMVGTLGGAVLLADGPDPSVDLAPGAVRGDLVEGLNEVQGQLPNGEEMRNKA